MSDAGDLLIGPARAAFEAALTGGTYRPRAEIRLAQLGADAGLIGAADLARRALTQERPGTRRTAAAAPEAEAAQSTAPLSGPEPRDGPSPSRRTTMANPPTNAMTASNAAQPGTSQPMSVVKSR